MNEAKTIGRKRKKNGFTQISNTLLEDTRLSWRAKGILCYILSRPDNWKINKTDLYKRATEGRDAMQGALDELKELGYLHIYRKKGENNLFDGWIWEYDDEPFTPHILKNHITEKPQEFDQIQVKTSVTDSPLDGFLEEQDSSTYNNTVFNNTDLNNTENKKIIKDMSISPKMLEKEFEQLWKIYPRKMGKKKSLDAFLKARKIKKIPYETIENGLYRYITHLEQSGTDEQYMMHGSTWFFQEKWQDEYVTAGINRKPKNLTEYLKAKYGGDNNEPRRDGEIIDYAQEAIPEFF